MEKLYENEKIKSLIIKLEESMINYLEYEDENLEDEVPYDRNDIKNCIDFIKSFLEKIENKENFLILIKQLKENLTNLNEKCKNDLIDEYDEYDIFEIILEVNKIKWFDISKEELEKVLN